MDNFIMIPPHVINMSLIHKVKGEVLLQFIVIFSVFLRSLVSSIIRLK